MPARSLQARSMLFTLFGDYVRHYGATIWVGSLIALMAELEFTSAAVRTAVSRMARQEWLVSIRSGRASYYALSPRGQARMDEAAQRIFTLHPERWDGKWRMLVVNAEVDRARRERLRRELSWMGFAPLSRVVFVSPNDLLDRGVSVAERHGLAAGLEAFTAAHEGPASDGAWAAQHWDLHAIDEAYAAFLSEWGPRLAQHREAGTQDPVPSDAACFVEKTRLVHAFRKLLFIDPGLPRELLPERWKGTEARGVFSAYYHALTEGALRFFEHHYRPAPGHEEDLHRGRQAARRDPFRPPVAAV